MMNPDLPYVPDAPLLTAYVERQLIEDLRFYGINTSGLCIDWSEKCPEGHVTRYLDGLLENWSDIGVVDANGLTVAGSWIELIHGGGDNPLFVFWEFLDVLQQGQWTRLKKNPGIPLHVWERLPDSTKDVCAQYPAWRDDPLVRKWCQARRSASKTSL